MEITGKEIVYIAALLPIAFSGWLFSSMIEKAIHGKEKYATKTTHVINILVAVCLILYLIYFYDFVFKGLMVALAISLIAFVFYSLRQCYIPEKPKRATDETAYYKQTDCLAIKSCIYCERNNNEKDGNDICDCKHYKMLSCFIEQHKELLKNINQK